MSLYKAPLETIISTINAQNKLDLNLEEYLFSDPLPIAVNGRGDNTELTISSRDLQSTYSGKVKVTYRRLALSEVVFQGNIKIPAISLETTRDVYQLINRYYGTIFTDSDIIIRDLTEEEKEIPGTIVLEAEPKSYGWVGTGTVSTRIGGHELEDYLIKTKLGGFTYPGNTVNRSYGHIYSYWRDFTTQYDELINLTTTPTPSDMAVIRDALVEVTGDAWGLVGASRYSLHGAKIVEVMDLKTELSDFYNMKYEKAIKVLLSDTHSLGLSGYIVLHFNEPFREG